LNDVRLHSSDLYLTFLWLAYPSALTSEGKMKAELKLWTIWEMFYNHYLQQLSNPQGTRSEQEIFDAFIQYFEADESIVPYLAKPETFRQDLIDALYPPGSHLRS